MVALDLTTRILVDGLKKQIWKCLSDKLHQKINKCKFLRDDSHL
jgi:hypothetical protein